MRSVLTNFIHVFEIASFLVSFIVFFHKATPRYIKLFTPLLLVTCTVEVIGSMNNRTHIKAVACMFNYYMLLELPFFFFVLFCVIQHPLFKKLVAGAGALFFIVRLISIIPNPYRFHAYSYSMGAMLLVFFCVYYFYEFFKAEHVRNLKYEPAFWICLSVLIFFSCTLPIWTTWALKLTEPEKVLYATILSVTNYVMYTLFIVAFWCQRNINKMQ
jgi:hypothetical protein